MEVQEDAIEVQEEAVLIGSLFRLQVRVQIPWPLLLF